MRKILNNLQLDVLRRHLGPFVFCFFTVMFILLMQFLILHVDKLIGKGLSLGIIIELILSNLAYMVVLAAPMAVLVSSLMAFGKFSELNELTALRAAGINPFKVMAPVLVSATILCVFLMWFSNFVLPEANQRARSLFIDIRLKKPGFDLKESEFYDGIDKYTFLVESIDNETDSLYNVTLFQEPSSSQEKAYIKADRGFLSSEDNESTLTLHLFDGSLFRYLDERKSNEEVIEKSNFNRYRISFDMSDLNFSRSNPEKHSRNDRTMSTEAMLAVIDSLSNEVHKETENIADSSLQFDLENDSTIIQNTKRLDYSTRNEEEEKREPFKSRYAMFNMLDSWDKQTGLRELALGELRRDESDYDKLDSDVEWRLNRIAQYSVEVHKKFSIPVACIIFVLLGAPIGMFTRKGNLGYAALISTVFLTFYWITIIQGEKLADRMIISPFTGMWGTNIVLGIIGLYMTVRLCTTFKISNLWNGDD